MALLMSRISAACYTKNRDRLLNQVVARRVFQPAEYLKPGEDEKQGLSATREISIKLHLDTTDLKPTGYRIFLFYP